MFQSLYFHKIAELASHKILLNFRQGLGLSLAKLRTEGFANTIMHQQSNIQPIGVGMHRYKGFANNARHCIVRKQFVMAIASCVVCFGSKMKTR